MIYLKVIHNDGTEEHIDYNYLDDLLEGDLSHRIGDKTKKGPKYVKELHILEGSDPIENVLLGDDIKAERIIFPSDQKEIKKFYYATSSNELKYVNLPKAKEILCPVSAYIKDMDELSENGTDITLG